MRASAGLGAVAVLAAVGVGMIGPACAKKRTRGVEVSLPASVPAVSRTATTGGAETTPRMEWAIGTSGSFVVGIEAGAMVGITEGRVKLSDGSEIDVRARVLRVTGDVGAENLPEPTSIVARMGRWLGFSRAALTQRWSAAPATRSGGAPEGERNVAPVLLVEVTSPPEMASTGGGVATGEIGGRSVRVRWLGKVERTDAIARVFERALGEAETESPWIKAALVLAERSPLTRWRSRLARGVLLGPEGVSEEGAGVEDTFDDPVVEALARTVEAQWIAGLSRLAAEDAVTARRVVERLCATLDFGGGVIAPAWPMDMEGMTELVSVLLEPGSPAVHATAWLDAAPNVLCWVIDDAGSKDAGTGAPEGTVGVANLMQSPLAAWADAKTSVGGPHIIAVSPRSVRLVPTGGAPRDEGAAVQLEAEVAVRGVRTRVQAGDLSFEPTVYSSRVPALAPGISIASMHPDWSLPAWLVAGQDMEYSKRLGAWGDGTGRGEGASGMVYRGVDAPLERGTSMPDRWLLFLEVVDRTESPDGFVRVWLGPSGRSRCVLKVMRDGRVLDESPPGVEAVAGDIPRLARVVETARGWTCWLSLPSSAIEADGLLRLGVERVDGDGVRMAWPRPMLPWQREPGRLAIGTETWGDR